MSSKCCLTGYSEKETLKKSLGWMSSWADGLAKDMMVIQDCLGKIGGSGCCERQLHTNYSHSTKEELESELDSIKALIGGLRTKIVKSYTDDGETILASLSRSFREIHEQCGGKAPIPIDGWGKRLLIDERMKSIGIQSTNKYAYVEIAGNTDFFCGRSGEEMFRIVDEQIDAALKTMFNSSLVVKENPDRTPIIILFQEQEVVNMLSGRIGTFTIFDENDQRLHVNISAMERLLMKWKNARIFFLKEDMDEFDFENFKKENGSEMKDAEGPGVSIVPFSKILDSNMRYDGV